MALPTYATQQLSFPEMYERRLVGPLFRPWVAAILDDLRLASGDRLLDIACGTGIVARLARERLGDGAVVGVDISEDMLAVARSIDPRVDWRHGDAAALPLRQGEAFDVVVCHQGFQFFPDPALAAAEMRRALAPGGRLAVAAWRSDEEVPLYRTLRCIAERRLGPVRDARYRFGEAAPVEAALRDAGLREVRSRILSRVIRFDDGQVFVRMNAMAIVGMSEAGRRMDEGERRRVLDAIIEESLPALRGVADGSGIAFEAASNLVTAEA